MAVEGMYRDGFPTLLHSALQVRSKPRRAGRRPTPLASEFLSAAPNERPAHELLVKNTFIEFEGVVSPALSDFAERGALTCPSGQVGCLSADRVFIYPAYGDQEASASAAPSLQPVSAQSPYEISTPSSYSSEPPFSSRPPPPVAQEVHSGWGMTPMMAATMAPYATMLPGGAFVRTGEDETPTPDFLAAEHFFGLAVSPCSSTTTAATASASRRGARQAKVKGAPELPQAPPNLGSPEMPSIGSALHGRDAKVRCRPCAFLYTKGCGSGTQCTFCHLCEPGEKKRRQQAKKMKIKERHDAKAPKSTLSDGSPIAAAMRGTMEDVRDVSS